MESKRDWKLYARDLLDALYSAKDTASRKRYYEALVDAIENAPFLSQHYTINPDAKRYADKVKYCEENCAIDWHGITPMDNGVNQCYLILLEDADGNVMFRKVGTTTRRTDKRMVEHLEYYLERGVRRIEVLRLYDCGDIQPEALESYIRANYILENSDAFIKNDRFVEGVWFDLERIDKAVESALENLRIF